MISLNKLRRTDPWVRTAMLHAKRSQVVKTKAESHEQMRLAVHFLINAVDGVPSRSGDGPINAEGIYKMLNDRPRFGR